MSPIRSNQLEFRHALQPFNQLLIFASDGRYRPTRFAVLAEVSMPSAWVSFANFASASWAVFIASSLAPGCAVRSASAWSSALEIWPDTRAVSLDPPHLAFQIGRRVKSA